MHCFLSYFSKIYIATSFFFFVMVGTIMTTLGCKTKSSLKLSRPWNVRVGDMYENFHVKQISYIKDFKSKVFKLQHHFSGATVVFFENNDDNKTFSIAFKTPPYDDTGLFHIFEHAVLSGSKRYPSKFIFFSLVGSSLSTMINASTHPVFTQYYFSSKVEGDFFNLLDPYLDAVFYPNVIQNPNIVKKEGWRFDFNEKTKNLEYNGIVFSEMKGAFSSFDYHLYFSVIKSLLRETPYAFNSGGEPIDVVKLKFDQIKDAHKRYYHPQNSHIFLYGNLNIKKALHLIHDHFLKNFKKEETFTDQLIPMQKKYKRNNYYKASYPVLSKKDLKNRTFMSLNYVIGKSIPLEDRLGLEVIASALVDKENSPAKKLLRKRGFAKDIYSEDMGTQENVLSFILEGAESTSSRRRFQNLMNRVLKDASTKGLPQDLIESTFNSTEFDVKESIFNSPSRGLAINKIFVENWIQKDYDIIEVLNFLDRFSKVRESFKNKSYIKNLVKKYFITNKKKSLVTLSPDPDRQKKFDRRLKAHFTRRVQKLEKEKLIAEDKEFKKWLVAKESKEIEDKLPTLKSSNLSRDVEELKFTLARVSKSEFESKFESKSKSKARSKGNKAKKPVSSYTYQPMDTIEIFSFPQNTGGINYVDFHFDIGYLPQNKKTLGQVSLLLYLLKNVDTKKRDYLKLSDVLGKNVGDISFSIDTFVSEDDPSRYKSHLLVQMKGLNHKSDISFELLREVLRESLFKPREQVKNLILELITKRKSSVVDRVPGLISLSGGAHFSESLKWLTYISGHMFELYLKEVEEKILKDIRAKKEVYIQSLIAELQDMFSFLFSRQMMTQVLLVGEKKDLQKMKDLSLDFISKLKNVSPPLFENASSSDYEFISGFEIPSRVQYVNMTSSYSPLGKKYHGNMLVFSRILTFEYLFKVLREKDGAYGARANFSPSGLFSLSTYRDPQLEKTYRTFEASSEFIKNFDIDAKKFNQFVVGSLKPYYQAKSPYEKARDYLDRRLSDISEEDYRRIKAEILKTKLSDVKKMNLWVRDLIKTSKKTAAGGKDKLKKEASFIKNKLAL